MSEKQIKDLLRLSVLIILYGYAFWFLIIIIFKKDLDSEKIIKRIDKDLIDRWGFPA